MIKHYNAKDIRNKLDFINNLNSKFIISDYTNNNCVVSNNKLTSFVTKEVNVCNF